MGINLPPEDILKKYEVHKWKHALAILKSDLPGEWNDLVDLLINFELCKSCIFEAGERKSKVAEAIDEFLYRIDWVEKKFSTSVKVDDDILESPTHKVDCCV